MFWSFFLDLNVNSMRAIALLSHLILTSALIWTKFESIQVAMASSDSDAQFVVMNQQYMGLVGMAVIFIIFELSFFLANSAQVTFGSVIHLFLDVCACFFITWIIVDGLSWVTYLYVWMFCVLLPSLHDLSICGLAILASKWIARKDTISTPIYERVANMFRF